MTGRKRSLVAPGLLALSALSALGCGAPSLRSTRTPYEIVASEAPDRPLRVRPVTQHEWEVARERLEKLRRGRPGRPYVERVRLTIHDPRSGRKFQARGAVAVSPERAARMILVGPGGTTALDLWVTADRFRFAVPAIKLEKRGGADPEEAKGLPIGMLRWWFLSPLGGRLLFARATEAESAWILRDGRATITVRSDGVRFVALRREREAIEAVEWLSRGLVPEAGERGRYVDGRVGLRIEVVVEDVLTTEPAEDAFADPDAPGVSL